MLTLQAVIKWLEKQDNCSAQSSHTSWNARAAMGATAGSLRDDNIMGTTSFKMFGCPLNQLPSEPADTATSVTFIHTYTHKHKHMHTHACAYTQIYRHKHIDIHTQTHTHKYTPSSERAVFVRIGCDGM